MDLSIVVPTYNVEAYLANCLESLLRQDLDPERYEILVVNDGSTDRSGTIADSFAEKHRNVRVVHQQNAGLSGARNTGIREAAGTYIYFIDSDDYIADQTLGFALKTLRTHELDVLGLGVLDTDRLDIYRCSNRDAITSTPVAVTDGITFIASHNYMNNAWWYIIRREFLLKTGLLFPLGRYVEDANFTAQMLVSANRVSYIPLDFYRYVVRPASIMRKKDKAHIRRLIGDYKKNVLDFHTQIKSLSNHTEHSALKPCLDRLRARQESFVFFGIVKALRNGFTPEEIQEYLTEFKTIRAYPIHGFIGPDYNKMEYKVLTALINRQWALRLLARFWPN